MTWQQILVLFIFLVPFLLVFLNRLKADVAALLIALTLGILQAAGLGILGDANSPALAVRALHGFAQPVVIILISLFIINKGMQQSGVTALITRTILKLGGKNEVSLVASFTLVTALLSLFMNSVAAGALLLTCAIDAARQTGIKPSKLLMPVSFASLLGGMATYFTTANMIVSDLLPQANPPQTALTVLSFAPTGGLVALAGLLFIIFFGRKLLPSRSSFLMSQSPQISGRELEEFYELGERTWEVKVLPGSNMENKTLAQIGLGEKFGITIAAILRGAHSYFAPLPTASVLPNDVLLIIGREDRLNGLKAWGVTINTGNKHSSLLMHGVSIVEVLVSPHARIIGKTLKDLAFRSQYGMTALALKRMGRSYRTDISDLPLQFSDTFLMIGARNQVRQLKQNADFIVLEAAENGKKANKHHALLVAGVLLAAITAAALGAPVFLSMLAAAIIIILAGVLTPQEAYQAVEWQAVFLIAGMYALSTALVQTGLAQWVGAGVTQLAASAGGLALAAGSYLLTMLLTQVMGGQVTALVTAPIVISAAIQMGVSPQAIAIVTAIGCSTSFLTPFAHPVNLLMLSPGNYRLGDFFRVGWVLTIICFVMVMLGLKLFWGF